MSYLEHFLLDREPFSINPDPRFFFNSPQHRKAREYLLHSAKTGKGLALLLGEVGTGKTTVVRKIFSELIDDKDIIIGMIVVTHSDYKPILLLQKIAILVGIENPSDSEVDIYNEIASKLYDMYYDNKKVVVIIDEANKITREETLEEIRALVNLEAVEDGSKLINIILVGMPNLEKEIKKNYPLYQRIAVRYNLEPLSEDVVKSYIEYRLRTGGKEDEIFLGDAINAIFKYSKGIPRLVNVICDNALMEAYLQRKYKVDKIIIEQVVDRTGLKGETPTPEEKGLHI